MSNFEQPGDVVTVIHAAVISVDDLIIIDNLVGIAQNNAAIGADIEMALVGVFKIPTENVAFTLGEAVWINVANKTVTSTDTGTKFVGIVLEARGAGTTPVSVRLIQSEG